MPTVETPTGQVSEYEKMVWLKGQLQALAQAISASKTENVEVDNLDEIRVYLKEELGRFLDKFQLALNKNSDNGKTSYEFKVPEVISLKDLGELTKRLDSLKQAFDKIEFKPNIEVKVPEIKAPEVKIPEIKIPEIIAPKAEVSLKDVQIDLSDLLDALEPLKYLSNKATSPLAVRLSDGKAFIEALREVVKGQEKAVQVFSSNNSMTLDEYKTVSGIPKSGGAIRTATITSGTPVNVSTTSVACAKVYLSADTDAGKVLVVGFSNLVRAGSGSKNGIILIPGNDPVCIETNDLKNLWVDAETTGGVLCGSYVSL